MVSQQQLYQQARKARDARFDGQFFVAVKSTGIFCRPICPAPSPKEENVEYFSLAPLAMQAGYRPCLRCRPDSAPGSFAWKGVDTTVERAIKLLRIHPGLKVCEICEKLGVSDRYLRALFTRKLGIAPKQFRIFEQLLFAKQLLHQSKLSVEDVAQASGFSSARRLQDNLKTGLQLTPTQIRKNAMTRSEPLIGSSAGTLHIQLSFRAPYDWQRLRGFLAMRAIAGIEEVSETFYARHFSLDKVSGYFKATFNQAKQCFDVQLQIAELSHIQAVVQHIRRVLDLDADPHVIHQGLLSTGLDSKALVSGLRIPGIWSTFEAGCRAILGQQISVKAAINLVTALAHQLGEKHQGKLIFPTAEAVAGSDLAFLKMPSKRRDSLRAFGAYCAQHPDVSTLDDWLSIKGIGPWTVAYAKMRGQSDPDIWLDTDLVIKKQIQQNQLNPAAAQPWRSYLTFQLWSMA
ncbi:DNA-3-methyladenine glycosylase 2 family protein [Aliiglaciecola litoralis]|uniref:AlkA N-terminal domain-containing protein n=1 Tax=Aliiglaciecola litoralis TaxID=582857 RepID=A0ABN1LEM7_9ALTE